jgi:uncharacterized protein involved in exopolysaccharide biosynthesis
MPTTLELEAQGAEVHFTLNTFWHVVVKRAGMIAAVTLIVSVLTSIYSYHMKPICRAAATMEVESDYPQLQSLNDLYHQSSNEDYLFLATQTQVMQSDNLAWTTMEQLGLDSQQGSAVPRSTRGQSAAQMAAAQKAARIEAFKAGLKVEPLKESRILEVTYEDSNPELAARIVNALVNNYVEFSFRSRYDFTRQASTWMEQQLEDLRKKVEKSQLALVDYERQNLIINVGDRGTITEQGLQDLSHEYTGAENDRVQKESIYELVKSNEGQIGVIVQNAMLERLEEKYSDLKANYSDAQNQFGPNFPKVVRLRDQLDEMQTQLDKVRKQAIQKVRNDYMAAIGREKLLATAMGNQKVEVSQLNQRMIEHNILKREFDTNQQLYENLLGRLKDATLSAGLHATNIHVIDQASPPTTPVRPNKVRNILAGLLVGLILGVTMAFVHEALDSSVRSTDEAERITNAPALAVIPVERDVYRRKQLPAQGSAAPAEPSGLGLAVLKRPSSPLAESFRSLRTSVMLSTAPRPPQTLLVTSPQVGEGKTSTATNLAISFAQRGGPILLIDAVEKHSVAINFQSAEAGSARLRAQVAIITTGVNGSLNRALGLARPRQFLRALQTELTLPPNGHGTATRVYVGQNVAPGAFAWDIPLGNGKRRVGLMTERNPEPYFTKLLQRIAPHTDLASLRIDRKGIAQAPVGRAVAERVVAAGEAAGHIKTTTGGGIYYGIAFGRVGGRRGDPRLSHQELQLPDPG